MALKSSIFVLFLSLLTQLTDSSSCGSASIPFSLEILPDGQPVLGCSRPKCFGQRVAGSPIVFSMINNRLDGYVQDSTDRLSKETFHEDARYLNPQVATCASSFNSENCNSDNQWVGGIAPSNNFSSLPLAVQCCEYEPLKNSIDLGLAMVKSGQVIIGGKVYKGDRQYAFDYISDITKHVNSDESISYEVNVRRMSCIPQPKEFSVYVEQPVLDMLGFTRPQAFQAPTQVQIFPHSHLRQVRIQMSHNRQEEFENIGQQLIDNQNSIVEYVPQRPAARASPTYNVPSYNDINYNQVCCSSGTSYWPSQSSSLFCFSADTQVRLSHGKTKRMDELNIDDWVFSANDSQITLANVNSWIHKMPKLKAEFIRIELSDGNSLKITSKHYIYKAECDNENELIPFDKVNHIPVFAEKVEVGDCLYVLSQKQKYVFEQIRVQKIDIVEEIGIYAPMTSDGNIIVNDIYASCMNIIDNKIIQDSFVNNVKMFPSIFGENEDETDLPYGTSLIVELMTYVLPKTMC